jgi:hypothetical protein
LRSFIGKGPVLALGLLLLAAFVVRPLAYGVSTAGVASFWGLVLLGVGLPGIVLLRVAGLYRSEPSLLVGQGLTLGLVLHGLLFLAGRVLGVAALTAALALLGLGGAVALFRRERPIVTGASSGHLPGLLFVLLLGCLIQPIVTLHLLGDPLPVDLLYHAGNAAELRHRWPLQDPRAAGLPLNYPVLAYALPVDLSRWSGLPVADALLGLCPLFWIALLALQTCNAGRLLLGDPSGAVLGSAVLLLHEDVGSLLGLGRGAFVSTLATALYGSPTTVCGLILLTGMTIGIAELLSRPDRPRGLLILLLVFAVAASLTKATVVPAAAGGCLLVAAWEGSKRRREPARAALVCALVIGLAAAPFTLRLGTGDTSYRGIFRWDPAAIVRQSPFAHWAARGLGLQEVEATAESPLPAWFIALASPAWFLGYLGLAGVGALVFVLRRREALTPPQLLALAVTAAGAVPALLFDAHGISQLFFLYNGQVLLAILAGGALAQALRRPLSVALLALFGLVALPSLAKAGRFLISGPADDYRAATRARGSTTQEYASGLAWLRAHAARSAVVFADNPSLLLSAFGECRLYYETGLYTPRGWDRRWEGANEPYPERASFQEALLRRPTPEVMGEALRLFPPPLEVLVVADSVQSRIQSGFLEVGIGPVPARPLLPPPFRPAFANRVMHVYRLGAPGS